MLILLASQRKEKEKAIADIDLAFATYGSLQHISSLDELTESLKTVHGMMAPGGILAVEMFSSEIYHFPVQPNPVNLKLKGELHKIGISCLEYSSGIAAVTTQIKRQSDGKIGVMKEYMFPVTREEAAEVLREAGFSSVEVKPKGAYLRCAAEKA